ncbi:MAG: hypothetical protein IPM51_07680 [Sphingobacteriaceae bacterium]|nr:hypothetical protein [Sphingobacteriaceae bacterium]
MRDVIWTIIAVWVIYKLIEIFKSPRNSNQSSNSNKATVTQTSHNQANKQHAFRKSTQQEGEYVDFEEVKD